MTHIIVDEQTLQKLNNLAEPMELRDSSGRVLGRFYPEQDASNYELREPMISEEELRQRLASPDWCTWDEVKARLEQLEREHPSH